MPKALITGASRGIGLAITQCFKDRGYEVLTPTRFELDLADPSSINAYTAGLPDTIDVLINNAGINELGGLADVNTEQIHHMLQVNLLSALTLIQAVAPRMKAQRSGRIVNLTSIWASFSKEKRLLYSMVKAGLTGLTTATAVELAPYGVLVNAVAPGFVGTEMTYQNNTPEQLNRLTSALPLQRLASPSEIAEAVFFLAGPANTFTTGQTLFVDGGFSCV